MHEGRSDAYEAGDDPVPLLRALFDEAPVMIALTRGPEHRFVLANRMFRQVAGQDPTGRTLVESLPEMAEETAAMIDSVLATGEPLYVPERRVRAQVDGAWIEQIIDLMLQRLSFGGGTDVLCIGYEITARIEAEQRSRALEDRLTQVARTAAFGTMAATLAHEINQPLTAAAAYLNAGSRIVAAIEDPRAAQAGEAMRLAEQQIQRAGEIIRHARRAVSDGVGNREPVPLRPMIDNAVRLVAAAGLLEGVRVEIAPQCADISVCVDRIQIEQVLVNLVRNAAEAMTGAVPKVLTFDAAEEDGMALVRVGDTGRGLVSGRDSFEAFARSSGGMGIGLALSRTIIEAHGGRIALENRAPRGAVVLLSLPVRPAGGSAAREAPE